MVAIPSFQVGRKYTDGRDICKVTESSIEGITVTWEHCPDIQTVLEYGTTDLIDRLRPFIEEETEECSQQGTQKELQNTGSYTLKDSVVTRSEKLAESAVKQSGDCLPLMDTTLEEKNNLHSLSLKEKSSQRKVTDTIARQVVTTTDSCIELFGKSTTEQSPQGNTFTILTEINQTTGSKICNVSHHPNTESFTNLPQKLDFDQEQSLTTLKRLNGSTQEKYTHRLELLDEQLEETELLSPKLSIGVISQSELIGNGLTENVLSKIFGESNNVAGEESICWKQLRQLVFFRVLEHLKRLLNQYLEIQESFEPASKLENSSNQYLENTSPIPLSIQTLEPSIPILTGEGNQELCLGDSPASECLQPESGKASIIQNPLFGGKCFESLPSVDRGLLLLKTLRGLSAEDYENVLPTSEFADIRGNLRSSYRQLYLERLTCENEFSLLPTPQSYAKGSSERKPGQTKLDMKLRLLPTPLGRDGKGSTQKKDCIEDRLRLLPTPVAQDKKGRHGALTLPNTMEPYLKPDQVLNPQFSLWMMGFPTGYLGTPAPDGGEIIQRQNAVSIEEATPTDTPNSKQSEIVSCLSVPQSPSSESSTSAALSANSEQPVISGLDISFFWTLERFSQGLKTVTRRAWKPSHAQKFINAFEKGKLIVAINKDRRYGGKAIALLKLTCTPYQEKLADMPEGDVALEGYPELNKVELVEKFFDGDDQQTLWVVRFEVVSFVEPAEPEPQPDQEPEETNPNRWEEDTEIYGILNELGFIESPYSAEQERELGEYQENYKGWEIYFCCPNGGIVACVICKGDEAYQFPVGDSDDDWEFHFDYLDSKGVLTHTKKAIDAITPKTDTQELITENQHPEIIIDPEFKALIPPLSPEEREQLEANLIEFGCRDPLTVWKDAGILLDGHNRKEICDRLGIPYQIFSISVADREDAHDWLIDNQLGRRNLRPNAISYFRGKQYNTVKKNQGKRTDINPTFLHSARKLDELAEQHNCDKATLYRDGAYAKAVDSLAESLGEEVKTEILNGTLANKADVVAAAQFAQTEPGKAEQILKHGRQSVQTELSQKAKGLGLSTSSRQVLPSLDRNQGDPSTFYDAAPYQISQPESKPRVKNDFYPTTEKLTKELKSLVKIDGRVLEPCVGDGAIAKLFPGCFTNEFYPQATFEPNEAADATSPEVWDRWKQQGFDWVVTNPPFTLAEKILPLAMDSARKGVAMLLRISYLEPCENRQQWLKDNADHLFKLIVFNPRPSFRTDTTGTDSATVAWFVWKKDFSWKALGLECPFAFVHGWRE